MSVVSTLYKEDGSGIRADIVENNDAYTVTYYDMKGAPLFETVYSDKSLGEVTALVNNWISTVKTLNE